MTDFLLQHWFVWVIGILAFAAGHHLGRVTGINDGLRRAWEIMNEHNFESPLRKER